MKKSQLSKALIATVLLTLASVCWGTTNSLTFKGNATVASVTILGATTTVNSTGALPSSGGARCVELVTLNLPGIVSGGVAHASTIGAGNHTDSSASVAGLSVGVGGLVLTADLIQSQAYAAVTNGAPTTSGGSSLVNLTIAGQTISINGFRNQVVVVPGGKIVINETIQSAGSIKVNALHVSLEGLVDVVLGSSYAAVGPCTGCTNTCTGTANCTDNSDFIIASGSLKDSLSRDAHFGLSIGLLKGKNWGDFAFEDSHSGINLESTSITQYQRLSATERVITGTALLNGFTNVTFALHLVQNDLGTGTFNLTLSNGYSLSGAIDVGFVHILQACN